MESILKTAVLTGGAQGIGKSIAQKLSALGIRTAIVDINLDKARETCGEIENTSAYQANVADRSAVDNLFKTVIQDFGAVHILINNAGITRDNLLMRMTEDEWDSVININLKGAFNCCQAVIRHMMKNKWGRIVNISSVAGLMGNAGQTNYSASKAGLIGLTKSIAKEVASRNITVNAVAPGFIQTAMTDAIPEKEKETLTSLIPVKKLGQPEDIAHAVGFLVSDDSYYITGQTLVVDGGMTM